MRISFLFILVGFLSACTNSLYYGETSYQYKEKDHKAVAYWRDQDEKGKPDVVTILDGCTDYPIQFSEQNDGTVKFFEAPGNFERLDDMGEVINSSKIECGDFFGKKEIIAEASEEDDENASYKAKALIYCNKIPHPIRKGTSMPARKEPYVFNIRYKTEFFFFGGKIEAPQKPVCN